MNLESVLACSVNNCGLPLRRERGAWRCDRGHSFDIARTGYVNLLQPQDRRSARAGDTREAVDARAQLLAAGIGRTSLAHVIERASSVPFGDGRIVVDLGCGSGEAVASLAERRPITAIGIDLSTAAIDRAARAYPQHLWVVANADRRLPILDHSVALVLSLHARRNPPECARVLSTGGHLLIAVPAADDLNELREAVQGTADHRDRVDQLIEEHAAGFTLVERSVARQVVDADRTQLRHLLHGTYRGLRAAEAKRAEALDSMSVTLATEVLVLARKREAQG